MFDRFRSHQSITSHGSFQFVLNLCILFTHTIVRRSVKQSEGFVAMFNSTSPCIVCDLPYSRTSYDGDDGDSGGGSGDEG